MTNLVGTDNREFFSGERLYVGVTHDEERIPKDHIDRYELACKYLRPDFVVLDAACGSGYGSRMLVSACKEVIGLDASNHAVEWANAHYGGSNLSFVKADLGKPLPLEDASFHAIVSFETLEHVADQRTMLNEFKRILKPGGLLFISTPDKLVFNGPGQTTTNPFHINEISKGDMLGLLNERFSIESVYGQFKFKKHSSLKLLSRKIVKALIPKRFRGAIVKQLGPERAYDAFSPHRYTPVEKIEQDVASGHCVIVAVCKKL